MKVLVVTQYFWPENFRINDLVLGLKERNHHVSVLTGMPNYPHGKLFNGYGAFKPAIEKFENIPVFRVPLIPRGNGSKFRLALNYLSFLLSASLIGPLRDLGKMDLIFIFEPSPITVCLPALLLKKLNSAPIFFWMQDLWPESLSATGAVRSKIILRLVATLVRFIYRNCDRILIQSKAFLNSIERLGGDVDRVLYFPNSAEKFYRKVIVGPDAPERKLFPKGFCVTFAGNIGAAQDFSTILGAAEILKANKDIHIMIFGDGRKRRWVENEIKRRNLEHSVHLLGRYPAESMPQFFALSDALMVTLKKEPIFELTIPSKIQSYLACAKPIIAALGGEGERIVKKAGAGIACEAENPLALADAVIQMAQKSSIELAEMGENGLRYFNDNFERDKLLDQLDSWIKNETLRG